MNQTSPTKNPSPRIGYLGLGIMGGPMAQNLLQSGYELWVWNRTASKAKALQDRGATLAQSPKALAEQGLDVIFINVTDTEDVEAVLFGTSDFEGLGAGAQPGLIVVDNSTISPVQTAEFAKRLSGQGVTLVDAPVSGGDSGAKQGTLSIMVGGPEESVNQVRPMLDILGKSVTHLGPAGAGQACKACNQVAVVNNLVGVCEAISLAKHTGLDVNKMIEVISGGAGGSWQLTNLGPKIADQDYDPGFMIDLVLKDLNIVRETAEQHSIHLPGTDNAQTHFQRVADDGGGNLGTQAIAKSIVE